ncbi:MAG TPA: hypothetical protein VG963_14490 [Polyangiaceae bacterium]|nr:hypothetical protein [Polyangiaceae bacterium]
MSGQVSRQAPTTHRIAHSASVLWISMLGLHACASGADDTQEERGDPAAPSHDAPIAQSAPAALDDPQLAGEPDELVAKGFLQASAQSDAEIFGWTANEWDVAMRPVDTHVCFLTRVSGNLGGNSVVALHRYNTDYQYTWRTSGLIHGTLADEGPTWKLGGAQAEDNSLSAEAICVPLSSFSIDPGMVIWTSGEGRAEVSTARPGCSSWVAAEMWQGNAATYLSSVQGDFEGGGEGAEIVYGEGWSDPAQVRIQTQQCGYYEAHAVSLFIGVPDQRGTWRTTAVEVDAGSNKKRSQRLLRTRDGVCYLTRVSGNFDGAGERVRIYPELDQSGDEWWTLEAKAQGGSAYSKAECVYYDQRANNGCADLCPL